MKKNSKTSLAKIQQEIDRLNKTEKGVTAESIPLPPGSYHCIRPTQTLAGGPPHSKLELTDLDRESVSKMLSKLKEKEFSLESFSKVSMHIPDVSIRQINILVCMYIFDVYVCTVYDFILYFNVLYM